MVLNSSLSIFNGTNLNSSMAELLKNVYNEQFFERFTTALQQLIPVFNKSHFLEQIYDAEWDNRELKQRMRHISTTLHAHLTGNYEKKLNTVLQLIPLLKENGFKAESFEFMLLPDFVQVYGLDQYQLSVKAMEEITQFTSCEFAVRPFLLQYEQAMLQQMLKWSKHKHPMVRRLATEGCRPRLPWAMGVPSLKKDPAPILPILKNLKTDSSESVRRSVANNLNDISKDHPNIVIDLVQAWKGQSKETDALVKHASRTLLKQGNTTVMELFGFGAIEHISIDNFQVHTPRIQIGESIAFSFNLTNTSSQPAKLRLEYGIYYQKANGTLSKKVYKISEKIYAENSTTTIHRKQHFKVITTRKLHLGLHRVALIINGQELDVLDFELVG